MDEEMRDETVFVQRLTDDGTRLFVLKNEVDIASLNDAIWRAHDEYICELMNEASTKPVKEQKKALKDLAKALGKVDGILADLGTEYIFRLDQDAKKLGESDRISFETLKSTSAIAANLIHDFLEDYSPPVGRPVNWALEHAVRTLLPVVETVSNCDASIKWNKNTDRAPDPSSKSTEFMVHVMTQFQGAPTQTAILNMITKVKEKRFPEKSNFDAVVEEQDNLSNVYGNQKSKPCETNPKTSD